MTDQAQTYLREAIQRAEAARDELEIEIKGLRFALARLRGHAGVDGPAGRGPQQQPASPESSAWLAMPRTDATVEMLRRSGGELHRKDLTDALHQVGRVADTIDAVSAALAYLARGSNPRVVSVGGGRWRLASASAPRDAGGEPFSPNESAASPTGGEGPHTDHEST